MADSRWSPAVVGGAYHAGFVAIGSGTPDKITETPDNHFVGGDLEVDGAGWFDAAVTVAGVLTVGSTSILGTAYVTNFVIADSSIGSITYRTDDGLLFHIGNADGNINHNLIFTSDDNGAKDHDHDVLSVDPTLFVHSALDPDTDNTEYLRLRWNDLSVGASKGAFAGIKSITEEVTVAIGTGAGGVASAGNLAPANALILSAVFRVTQAPGGGATLLDIGRTGGGNLDELIDGASCDVLGEAGNTVADRAADTTQLPIANPAAATLTLTTDANVTGTDMKVRVAVFYIDLTEPTS